MAYDYLKNVLKFKFPEVRTQEAQREAEAAAREVGLPGLIYTLHLGKVREGKSYSSQSEAMP